MAVEDEATFGLIPLVARGWAKKGSHPTITINHAHKYTNVFGARTKNSFVFQFSKRKKQQDFIRFCEKLLKRWKKVLLFVDGGPCHKGKLVNAFLKKNRPQFRLKKFLAYTPELNPVEQCWQPARKNLANRLLKTLPAAKYHLRQTFKNPKNLHKMFKYLRD